MKPLSALVVPSSTNANMPGVTLAEVSASAARVQAPADTT
jgi:hypothetical protein